MEPLSGFFTTISSTSAFVTQGTYFGQGHTDFTSMGVMAGVSGGGAKHGFTRAFIQEYTTITDPGIADGTLGTIQYEYDIHATRILGAATGLTSFYAPYASASLKVRAGASLATVTDVLVSNTNIEAGGLSLSGLLTDPISFTYGESFLLQTQFQVTALLDTVFVGQSNLFFLHYNLGTIESIEADALSTSSLTSIIIGGGGANATIMGGSGTNYSGFVAGNSGGGPPSPPPVTVPEPTTMSLFLLGLSGCCLLRRRRMIEKAGFGGQFTCLRHVENRAR